MIIYLPSVPGAVSAINIGVLNTSAVRITWSPVEEANGNITHYIVSVSLYERRELYNENISVSSDLLNDIEQEGISNQTLFFTEEDGRYNMGSYIDSKMCNCYFSSSCSY